MITSTEYLQDSAASTSITNLQALASIECVFCYAPVHWPKYKQSATPRRTPSSSKHIAFSKSPCLKSIESSFEIHLPHLDACNEIEYTRELADHLSLLGGGPRLGLLCTIPLPV